MTILAIFGAVVVVVAAGVLIAAAATPPDLHETFDCPHTGDLTCVLFGCPDDDDPSWTGDRA